MKSASGPHVASSMRSIPLRLLVIRPVTNPSIPCRAPLRISTPASAGPTVGANCRGKVTADVRRVGLIVGPLLRGEFKEGVDIGTGLGELSRFGPDGAVKTYSCFMTIWGSTPQ